MKQDLLPKVQAAESRVPDPEWTGLWIGLPGHPPVSGNSHLPKWWKAKISDVLSKDKQKNS